jgi:hypothetical protein
MNTSESSQLALVAPSDWRELASREADGLAVTLLWSKASNQVKVAVADTRSDEAFEVEVAGADALAAFYHPFAYVAREYAGLCAADLVLYSG